MPHLGEGARAGRGASVRWPALLAIVARIVASPRSSPPRGAFPPSPLPPASARSSVPEGAQAARCRPCSTDGTVASVPSRAVSRGGGWPEAPWSSTTPARTSWKTGAPGFSHVATTTTARKGQRQITRGVPSSVRGCPVAVSCRPASRARRTGAGRAVVCCETLSRVERFRADRLQVRPDPRREGRVGRRRFRSDRGPIDGFAGLVSSTGCQAINRASNGVSTTWLPESSTR